MRRFNKAVSTLTRFRIDFAGIVFRLSEELNGASASVLDTDG